MKFEGKPGKDLITQKRKREDIAIRSEKKKQKKEENTLKAQRRTKNQASANQIVDHNKKDLHKALESEILSSDSAKIRKKKP